MQSLFLPLSFIVFLYSCTETKKESPVSYEAGFKTIHTTDTSRIYKPGTDTTGYLHYRPIDMDIWYPAIVSNVDTALLFRDIIGLLETRANYYTASTAGNGLTQQLAEYFCTGLKCSDTASLLNFRTSSYKNSQPAEARFPLVIYFTAFNGMSYENYSLFEKLAKRGFVVLSISSIGRYPGDMSMKKEDLMEQVYDAVASFKQKELLPHIDYSKIGIVGYSWGGLAASIFANKIPGVTCLVSLDGSEFHHYGQAKEEDEDFEIIRQSADFENINPEIAYLRLESAPPTKAGVKDSVYHFTEKLPATAIILKVDSAQHEDFGCLTEIVRESGNCAGGQYFKTISKLTIGFLEEHLVKEGVFQELLKGEMGKTVKRK